VQRIANSFPPPAGYRLRRLVGPLLAGLTCSHLAAAACTFESPAHRLTVLELYTSEGCNSCPPADRWLSGLRDRALDAQVLPLAFHVDYWNDLGWIDRFSQPAFSARQHGVAERNRSGFVYTPQLVLDGRDWRGWRGTQELSARLKAINAEAPGAAIRAGARLIGDSVEVTGSVALSDRAGGEQARAAAALTWISIYEQGLSTTVGAGENRGRTLTHDYVVRALVGPLRAGVDRLIALNASIALRADWKRERLGIAVFTEDAATGRVLQAASASGCLARRDAALRDASALSNASGSSNASERISPGGLPNAAGL